MTSFTLFGSSSVARTLASGETGVLTPGSALAVTGAPAISGTGVNYLVVDGAVYGIGNSPSFGYAYFLNGLSASIQVGTQGVMSASLVSALQLGYSTGIDITNNGEIRGGSNAITANATDAGGGFDLYNTGLVTGDVHGIYVATGNDNAVFTNTGQIIAGSGSAISAAYSDRLFVLNDGLISATSTAITGADSGVAVSQITNSGTILGRISLNEGDDLVINSGQINKSDSFSLFNTAIHLGSGDDRLENGGEIIGNVEAFYGSDTIINTGSILGDIYLGPTNSYPVETTGSNVLLNSGSLTGTLTGSPVADAVTVTGLIDGTVRLGAGDDLFNATGGQVTGPVDGAGGHDTIIGTDHADRLSGGTENDSLVGGQGDDSLSGGGGLDTIMGGAGDDTILTGAGSDSVGAGSGHDLVEGEGGNDTLIGFEGDDTLNGNAGSDSLSGGEGDDELSGGDGLDVIRGGAGNDRIGAGTAADTVYGGAGDDEIIAWTGDDLVFGNDGRDTLNGGEGADTLDGGWGDDTVTGGSGADVFVVIRNAGDDIVTDFENGTDLIDLTAFNTTFGALDAYAKSAFNGGTRLDLDGIGGTGSVWVQGVNPGFLNADDFLF